MSAAERKAGLPPAPEHPDAILAEADAEIRAAEEAVETLEGAVRNADESVTFEDVEAARKRLDWARLRRAAADVRAHKLASQQAAEAAQQAIATFYDRATADIGPRVRELLAQARGPIKEALETVAGKNAAIVALASRLQDNPQPGNPATYSDGRAVSAWVQGPDGRQHTFTYGQKLVTDLLDDVVRELL